jgi:hypothetical protein
MSPKAQPPLPQAPMLRAGSALPIGARQAACAPQTQAAAAAVHGVLPPAAARERQLMAGYQMATVGRTALNTDLWAGSEGLQKGRGRTEEERSLARPTPGRKQDTKTAPVRALLRATASMQGRSRPHTKRWQLALICQPALPGRRGCTCSDASFSPSPLPFQLHSPRLPARP